MLRESDFSDLTVDRLARHVRMSKSTLYKHFQGKDDLVDAVIAQAASPFEESLASLPQHSSARDRVEQVLAGWHRFSDALPSGLRGSVDQLPRPARRRLDALIRELELALSSAVNQAGADGLLKGPPELTRVALVAAAKATFNARSELDGGVVDLVPLFWKGKSGSTQAA